jgi:hypothetical protein
MEKTQKLTIHEVQYIKLSHVNFLNALSPKIGRKKFIAPTMKMNVPQSQSAVPVLLSRCRRKLEAPMFRPVHKR